MNIFKRSYRIVRKDNEEIFKGFGFKHLSDATQYYLHPNNKSFKGTTTLCQPIGEGVILFCELLKSIQQGKGFGGYYVNDDRSEVYMEFTLPDEWLAAGVVPEQVHSYKVCLTKKKNTFSLGVGAYNDRGQWLDGDMQHLSPLYKLLPLVMVIMAYESENDGDYRLILDRFLKTPAADSFVNLHEDLYQNYKETDFDVSYYDLTLVNFDLEGMHSYADMCEVISEDEKNCKWKEEVKIVPFPAKSFTKEQLKLVPKLGEEFALPENLQSVCNAMAAGDSLAVLFHGPAGTGKTMSCKLVAQAIGLPLMETINCTENLDEFVLGKYIPKDDKIVFQESQVTAAIRKGGAVVFEEINFAKPQYLAFLNSLLDDNGFVRLDNGEVVKRHKNFRFFATMNIGYFGTKELNQALYNRFSAIVEIAALSDEAIGKMLVTRVPECKAMVPKILGVYHKIKKKIESEELDIVISPRNLENWVRLAKYEGYMKAAEKTILPVAKCDRALEETMRGILMLYKWNDKREEIWIDR